MNYLRPSRKHLRGVLQIAISLILLIIVLGRIEWAELRGAVAQMSLPWLAVAWLLFLAGIFVRGVRWSVLLTALGVRRPLGDLVKWYFVGGFFNVLLPTGFGGDAVRVVELTQDTQRAGPVLNSVVVDRYLGLMALLAMGLLAGLLRPELAPPAALGLLAVLFAGGVAAAWFLTRTWWQKWAARPGTIAKLLLKSRLPSVAEGFKCYGSSVIVRATAVSVGFNLLQIAWNIAIGAGLGLHLPVALYFVVVPLTSAALLLPAFGGLGVREMSYVALLGGAGVPEATALALSLSVYAITVAAGLLGGLIYLIEGLRRTRRKT